MPQTEFTPEDLDNLSVVSHYQNQKTILVQAVADANKNKESPYQIALKE